MSQRIFLAGPVGPVGNTTDWREVLSESAHDVELVTEFDFADDEDGDTIQNVLRGIKECDGMLVRINDQRSDEVGIYMYHACSKARIPVVIVNERRIPLVKLALRHFADTVASSLDDGVEELLCRMGEHEEQEEAEFVYSELQ